MVCIFTCTFNKDIFLLPCFKGNWSERLTFTKTHWNRSERYDLNQASTLSVSPKSDSRRPISLSWCTVVSCEKLHLNLIIWARWHVHRHQNNFWEQFAAMLWQATSLLVANSKAWLFWLLHTFSFVMFNSMYSQLCFYFFFFSFCCCIVIE